MTSLTCFSLESLKEITHFQTIVLLIDDQVIVGEALKRLFSDQSDISFHFCREPSEAIEMAKRLKPTVILQDLVMPQIDGLDLLKEFRSIEETKEIPIIVLSSKEDSTIKARAFELGASDYLVKFPDKVELIARLRHHSNSFIHLLERNEILKKLRENQAFLYQELAEAASYVKSLLPAMLHEPIKTQWRFIPSAQLGGDTFGYHWLDDEHFAVYLLDVCGHGVGAALLSVSVVNLLRSGTLPNADFKNPSSVLAALNNAFPMEEQNQMFFTIWYGVFHKTEKKLLYASAGHPPAILMSKKENNPLKIQQLTTEGIAIGVFENPLFVNDECQVQSGDELYIFSDGIYEIENEEGNVQGVAFFIDILSRLFENEESLDQMISLVQKIQGKNLFSDDVSLLKLTF